MTKSFTKIISLLLIIGMNWSAVSLISGTDACLSDAETSENNTMEAGVLDFELSSENDFQPEVTPIQNSTRIITVNDNSTMDYNYRARVKNASGELCDSLYMEDEISGTSYSLANFVSDEVLFSERSVWIFSASLIGNNSLQNGQTCQFDLVYEGWQDNMNYGNGGFSDVEIISNTILYNDQGFDSCMKINEVYYRPDCAHGDDPNDEWIELYNSCDYEVNLKNWYLEDDNGHEDLNHNYIIDPHQFVVIAANASTWTYWPNIPDNAFKIALGGVEMFTDGLNNCGDVVILYDDHGNQIDEVSWGYNTSGLDPSVPNVDEGHSISRNPKGYDNNVAGDWMDTYDGSTPPGPNPGTNPHSEDGTLLPPPVISFTPEPVVEPIPWPISDLMIGDMTGDGGGESDDTGDTYTDDTVDIDSTDDDIMDDTDDVIDDNSGDTDDTDSTDDDDADNIDDDKTTGADTNSDDMDDGVIDDTDDGTDSDNDTAIDDADDDIGDADDGDNDTDTDDTDDTDTDDDGDDASDDGSDDTGDTDTGDDDTDDDADADDSSDDTDTGDVADDTDTGDDTNTDDDTQDTTSDTNDSDDDMNDGGTDNGDGNGNADTGDKEEASEETKPEAGDDGSEETKPEAGGDDTTSSATEDGGDSDGGLGDE